MLLLVPLLALVTPVFNRDEPRVLGFPLFRLPGDISIRRGNFAFYFPLATSIVLSILLTLLFSLFRR